MPDILVLLDKDVSATTDSEGRVEFADIVGRTHTVAIDQQAIDDLATHSVVCEETSQRVTLDGETEIDFCFTAQGFMEVDVSEEEEDE